jgi:hypothetical protein
MPRTTTTADIRTSGTTDNTSGDRREFSAWLRDLFETAVDEHKREQQKLNKERKGKRFTHCLYRGQERMRFNAE